jgi:hypothetical protein
MPCSTLNAAGIDKWLEKETQKQMTIPKRLRFGITCPEGSWIEMPENRESRG